MHYCEDLKMHINMPTSDFHGGKLALDTGIADESLILKNIYFLHF